MPITPPIFVRSDDLFVFPSIFAAESYLEPVDVEPTDRAYDAQNRLFHVSVRGEVMRRGAWIDQSGARVELVLAEDDPGHADELRAALADWLGEVEGTPGLAQADLQTLVEHAKLRSARIARTDSARTRWILTSIAAILVAFALWWLASR